MLTSEKSRNIVSKFLKNGFLLSKGFLDGYDNILLNNYDDDFFKKLKNTDCIIINEKTNKIKNIKNYNWLSFDKKEVLKEKQRNNTLIKKNIESINISDIYNDKEKISDKINNINKNTTNIDDNNKNYINNKIKLSDKTNNINKNTTNIDDNNKNYINNKIKIINNNNDNNNNNNKLNINTNNKNIIHEKGNVLVIDSYDKKNTKKRDVSDFVSYFNKRYDVLEKILREKRELENSISISRILSRKQKDKLAVIGLVVNKRETNNGHIMLTVEDKTGTIKVLINKNKSELYKEGKDIVFDEILGITGTNGDKIIFADNILFPDIAIDKKNKKTEDEIYSIFMSDIHVGSKNFMEIEFNKFLKWINCEVGDLKQKETAKKVKYIFIVGDIVDGCGIYQGQENDLIIKDIYEQYKKAAELLSRIPKHIQIIISPGNHDAMRIAEPQPKLYNDFSKAIYDIPNVTLVSNPSYVNIHKSKDFSGFDVLMYHGYSFDYYFANIESIRKEGGYDRSDLMMKFLLKRRHLAPTHGSTLYLPDDECDHLVIDKIPDFFVTGHIHNTPIVSFYKGINTLSCGCFQSKTAFQEKIGHNPGPCKIPLVNLATRKVKILRF